VVDTITFCSLLYNGFYIHRTSLTCFVELFPFRPLTLVSAYESPVKHLTYWHRPYTSKTRLPILFIHGIGIGLYPYTNFLRVLNTRGDEGYDGDVGIIAQLCHVFIDGCKPLDTSLRHLRSLQLHIWGPIIQKLPELIETNWFCQKKVNAAGEGLLSNASRSKTSQGDDHSRFLPSLLL
jgi:hypothetical protein